MNFECDYKMLIDGVLVTSNRSLYVINPATGLLRPPLTVPAISSMKRSRRRRRRSRSGEQCP
jgi:hypothetical protein